MKKIIALVTLVLSMSAVARESVNFSYSGYGGGNRSFYACDFAESEVEKYLNAFGATEVDIDCRGGIQNNQAWPLNITASFETPVLSGAEATTISVIKGNSRNSACSLNRMIVSVLAPSFKNVKLVKKSDACAGMNSSFYYVFEVTK